jgi:imidazolonepropionase
MLIRGRLIDEVGPARRVENLAGARMAREIDAAGKIVLPAFCDPDLALVAPPKASHSNPPAPEGDSRTAGGDLRTMSRKRVLAVAMAAAQQCVRYGCLTVGSHTGSAGDLKNLLKLLRAHRALQKKPLRIRPILSVPAEPHNNGDEEMPSFEARSSKWMTAVRGQDLASVVEFTLRGREDLAPVRSAAIAAAEHGFTIRMRSEEAPDPALLQLALATGAMAILAPPDSLRAFAGPLASIGCVRVIPAAAAFDDPERVAASLRSISNEGPALALASGGPSTGGFSALNPQYLLHLAVERLGLTPEEAIVAASYNAACSLRTSHTTGSLEPGKSADVIIADVPDYRDLHLRAGNHDLSLVMQAGKVVWRAAPLSLD